MEDTDVAHETGVTHPGSSKITDIYSSLLSGVGVVATLVGFALVGGPPGLVVAGIVVTTRYLVGRVYGFAVGQLALATLAGSPTPASLVIAELGLFAFLAAALAEPGSPYRNGASFVIAVVVVSGTAGAVMAWTGSTAAAALAVITVVAVLSYVLHRYELVSLDLVEDPA